ncbi:MAG: DegT/DnrJ/EryC1/StrS family aminotransferase [Promethearchaeota archaeon]
MSYKKSPKQVFPKWPVYDENDINAMVNLVKSRKWWCGFPGVNEGKNVWLLQREFAKFQEAKHCIAVCNGTVAIEAALMALDIGFGDEVIVSD